MHINFELCASTEGHTESGDPIARPQCGSALLDAGSGRAHGLPNRRDSFEKPIIQAVSCCHQGMSETRMTSLSISHALILSAAAPPRRFARESRSSPKVVQR